MKIFLMQSLYLFFTILIWIMIVRILLSWFPNINWYSQPFKALKDITDPILEPFRKIIPPISGIDFSPIAAFLALEIIREIAMRLLTII